MIKLPVDDENEIQFSRWIMRLFERITSIETALKPLLEPQEGSHLFSDDKRSPHYNVSGYAYGQIAVAIGCIASLKQMMVQESGSRIDIVASPFGAYALVRNAIDSAAAALWLLEPVNGSLRIKRRLLLGADEVSKAAALSETMGHPSHKRKRRDRLQEVAVQAGLSSWNPLSMKLPTMTRILKDLDWAPVSSPASMR